VRKQQRYNHFQKFSNNSWNTKQYCQGIAMAPNILHLPNGQTITVTSVYGGLYFKVNDLNTHQHSQMPPGWTIILHSEDDNDKENDSSAPENSKTTLEPRDELDSETYRPRPSHIHRYRRPTLHNDAVFISSISNPSSNDFKPAVSPTRQIAMMLWATLWWYFHQVSYLSFLSFFFPFPLPPFPLA
jgi:N5-hydroxyornithine acetyltransferase